MSKGKYDLDKLVEEIETLVATNNIILTSSSGIVVDEDIEFIKGYRGDIMHCFVYPRGKVMLFYTKKIETKTGKVLFENEYCSMRYSVYEIFKNLFGDEVAKKYQQLNGEELGK